MSVFINDCRKGGYGDLKGGLRDKHRGKLSGLLGFRTSRWVLLTGICFSLLLISSDILPLLPGLQCGYALNKLV